ncbi:hypothetical protein [Stenotrophomonas rhizophila]|uniref:RiboL-PSP-HEPN domain-containing protein n=1 Tax=Stenotrophomonas rhizophila TaxID=216778 RepID=A0A7V8CC11_9GAMM|nr:hypothetical protein [Stenotrophomonas rhizophila]KAB7628894.1 hypothetical protein F9K92_15715 [Stenotrophomonas rhizophila]
MPAADLEFALADFKERTKQIRQIMAVVESAGRSPAALTTPRAGIDLNKIAASTSNTANSMALIFLASAFEEFVREEAIQCGNQLMENYSTMPAKSRNAIRDSYWSVSRDRFKFTRSILVGDAPEPLLLAKVKVTLGAMQGFVVDDDAGKLDSQTFGHHSNNFRPGTVREIFGRFAIKDLTGQLAEYGKLKGYFGVSTKAECSSKLIAKWDEFYDRRNETVHSLSGATGFAVDAVISYIELLELTAEALKSVLTKALGSWS